MQKWEYLYIMLNAQSQILEINGEKVGKVNFIGAQGEMAWDGLNRLGRQGWELVGFSTFGDKGWERMILKRPQ
jgi:hypothetical protein